MENDEQKSTIVIYIYSELMGFGDDKLACEGPDKADILVSIGEADIKRTGGR